MTLEGRCTKTAQVRPATITWTRATLARVSRLERTRWVDAKHGQPQKRVPDSTASTLLCLLVCLFVGWLVGWFVSMFSLLARSFVWW